MTMVSVLKYGYNNKEERSEGCHVRSWCFERQRKKISAAVCLGTIMRQIQSEIADEAKKGHHPRYDEGTYKKMLLLLIPPVLILVCLTVAAVIATFNSGANENDNIEATDAAAIVEATITSPETRSTPATQIAADACTTRRQMSERSTSVSAPTSRRGAATTILATVANELPKARRTVRPTLREIQTVMLERTTRLPATATEMRLRTKGRRVTTTKAIPTSTMLTRKPLRTTERPTLPRTTLTAMQVKQDVQSPAVVRLLPRVGNVRRAKGGGPQHASRHQVPERLHTPPLRKAEHG
ncbi:uncharacterized protein LOC135388392 [Ornithodoros turicata]|uniref:uncharacterized protein LOC135388392 n=1 Tax=Ornithodoros turicata TaxID=34597 RepID=UPI0031387414